MSIDDLTLTDLTIVKTQMLRLKFILTLCVCERFCIWFMNRMLRIA
jgi:hypothetical protein